MVLKECNTGLVYSLMDGGLLAKAKVTHAEAKITLYLEDDSFFEFKSDRRNVAPFEVDFFDSKVGYVKTQSNLRFRRNFDPWILDPWAADCEITKVIDIIQRQQDLRIPLNQNHDFLSSKHGHFKGIIENISVGGIMLLTETPLEVNEEFSFFYCFSKREFEIRAVILREQPMKKEFHVYGCRFMELPRGMEKDIRWFVYRQQLRRIW